MTFDDTKRMTREDITKRFPNASQSFIDANLSVEGAGKIAEPEPVVRPVPLAAGKVEKENSSRFLVRVCSVRKRLIDEDNLCPKFHVDLLRYSGALDVDSPDRCHIETTQRRAAKDEAEYTEITVFELPPHTT